MRLMSTDINSLAVPSNKWQKMDWSEMFRDYQATVDFLSYRYYSQLREYYPEAKVILTVRDPEEWYESAFNTIYQVVKPQTGLKQ